LNIGDKGSSSDLETGAEPHRLELEEEFGEFLQEIPLYPLLCGETASRPSEAIVTNSRFDKLIKHLFLIIGRW